MPLRLALPKGRLQPRVAAWLHGWGITGYGENSRSYRPTCSVPGLQLKVFQERDIPVQVAVGNYDLGICGRDWVEELLARYPQSPLLRVQDLGFGRGQLFLAAARNSPWDSLQALARSPATLRLASQYPNLTEALALRVRLRRFQVFPLWGAAEVYPPESADLVLVAAASREELVAQGLVPLEALQPTTACLIAHRPSWEGGNLAGALEALPAPPAEPQSEPPSQGKPPSFAPYPASWVRLALPDGHLQPPTREFLPRAGLPDYVPGERRFSWEGVGVKVVRPQDMPLQVANGNFDLAITGEDWLRDHLVCFPGSPVQQYACLGFARVKIVAVTGPDGTEPLAGRQSLRVASEYVNLADRYMQEKHLRYRVIPTWGASEAFLPEDADLLIENMETGQTLASHGLQVVEVLFQSSACLIGHKEPAPERREPIAHLVEIFRRGIRS